MAKHTQPNEDPVSYDVHISVSVARSDGSREPCGIGIHPETVANVTYGNLTYPVAVAVESAVTQALTDLGKQGLSCCR